MEQSLFDKYGGFETIAKLVYEFYRKVLKDIELKPYFKNSNMDQLMEHQAKFLSHILGGPDEYAGRELKEAHKTLNITDEHFELVAEYLEETLDEGGVEDDDVKTIMGIVASVKNLIVRDDKAA